MKKIVIVGAGPAGLFAANELSDKFKVIILDSRKEIGGSGLHSDGKLIFHPQVGGDLTQFLAEKDALHLLNSINNTFEKYGVEGNNDYRKEKMVELESMAAKAGIRFISSTQKHIGSDRLPNIISRIKFDLERKGVEFKLGTKALNLKLNGEKISYVQTNKGKIKCDATILAPGRNGSEWLKKVCNKLGIKLKFNPVDIGVRVEISAKVMEEVTNIAWDPKFHIRTRTYDDLVRTFCVCPYGFVATESYGNSIFGVNGFSMYNRKSENTNFAFLTTISLTEPLEDTTEYGKLIANQTNILGGNQPLIQRLGDLKAGKRSTWERISRSHIAPTLKRVTPGDISMAYPHRIIQNILEGLDMLSNVVPGINSDSTLLYAPEIKFYARRVETNEKLQTKIPNLFVAGDGAGVSRGIVGAAATGVIAAREISRLL